MTILGKRVAVDGARVAAVRGKTPAAVLSAAEELGCFSY